MTTETQIKKSKIAEWVKATCKELQITEQYLAKHLERSVKTTLNIDLPDYLSYGSEWMGSEHIGIKLYDENLDCQWDDDGKDHSKDEYIILKNKYLDI